MEKALVDFDAPLAQVCSEHPEVKDVMAEAGFTEILKPGMLGTVGKLMTIRKGCAVRGVDVDELAATFQKRGFAAKGYEKPEVQEAPRTQAPRTPEERKAELGDLVRRLSDGESLESVRAQFVRDFEQVSADEIARAEQDLIDEGYALSDMRRLCDVHSSLFHGRSEEECTLAAEDPGALPEGHPLSVLAAENDEIEKILDRLAALHPAGPEESAAFIETFRELAPLKIHYAKKEELLMPLLDAYGYPGPSEVMWGVDDEIVHEAGALAKAAAPDTLSQFLPRIEAVLKRTREMLWKEEQILFPLCRDHFTKEDWYAVYRDLAEFGPAFIPAIPHWLDGDVWAGLEARKDASSELSSGIVKLPTGELTLEQLSSILAMLPLDLTFVDADDRTQFFTNEGKVFARPLSCLGRPVWSCHPPRVQMMVRTLIKDFREGTRDQMEVWMEKGGEPVRVQYLAVRKADGSYIGTLEIVERLSAIKEHLEKPQAPRPHPFP